MPRPIAFSAKQKREQLQDKRAVKRGELDPSEVRYARNPAGNYRPSASHLPDPSGSSTPTSRLISKFISLTPEYVSRTRDLAHTVPLPRPVSDEVAVFPIEWMQRDKGRLTCPARPTFKEGQTKADLERDEKEAHAEWLEETTDVVEDWAHGDDKVPNPEDGQPSYSDVTNEADLRSPTWFETNLEVWRQLWRVTELSHVLLLLADARCPALHLPTSLRTYVHSLRPPREVILVLTKSDLVEPEALVGWKDWVKVWWAGDDVNTQSDVQVVTVQSYDGDVYREGSRPAPDLSREAVQHLVEALQLAHARAQGRMGTSSNSTRAPRPVSSDIDWDALAIRPTSESTPRSPQSSPSPHQHPAGPDGAGPLDGGAGDDTPHCGPLTIGLIGQPSVGKSSLLNAILGEKRVRAGRTPGKTKHFQTMFWGDKKQVKFVDCPGLVCPSLIGLELQALCGILPIARMPSLPSCVSAAARLAPLEEIFSIAMPVGREEPNSIDEYAHKRTWRTARVQEQPEESQREQEWTAWKIMEGRALDRGYMTAKTGRPDVNRAGTSMMLALAEGRVRWCFYPPGLIAERPGRGIWSGTPAVDTDGQKSASGSDTDVERPTSKAKLGSRSNVQIEQEEEHDHAADLLERAETRSLFSLLSVCR